jgi:hypothetical protein
MFYKEQYTVFFCKAHKKYIHYLKKENGFNETQCWDCTREANLSKSKKESKLRHAREQFSEEFSHFWTPNIIGGIVSAKIEAGGINVSIESSVEVFNEMPIEYMGYVISKQIVGASL